MSYAIALDLGSTFLKGAVLNLETMSLGSIVRRPFPEFIADLPTGWREILPDEIVAAVRELLDQLLAEIPDCEGIVMCSQMHTVVLVDKAGKASSNAISWMDQRLLAANSSGHTHIDILRKRLTVTEIQELGNELRPGIPLGTLFWFQQTNNFAESGLIPLSWPDYVLTQIAQAVPCTDLTNAAAHGALDIGVGTWHTSVIEKLGLSHLTWPNICPHGTVVGEYSHNGRKIPCYTPVGDQQSALLGAQLDFGELSLNVSTGSQVSLVSQSFRPGSYQVRPFFNGSYLNTITHLPAGRSLNALTRLLTEIGLVDGDPWEFILQAVDQVPETDLKIDLSFYDGALGREGSITNIKEGNLSVGSIFRASFNAMALAYRQMAQRLDGHWDKLVFSGGLVNKTPPLQKAILGQFQCPFRFALHTEDTLYGLLILARSWINDSNRTPK